MRIRHVSRHKLRDLIDAGAGRPTEPHATSRVFDPGGRWRDPATSSGGSTAGTGDIDFTDVLFRRHPRTCVNACLGYTS